MSVQIIEVITKGDLARFIDFPWVLYQSYPHWVPVLKTIQRQILHPKHPFYKTADMAKWMALRDGQVVGRIAAIVNHTYNKMHSVPKGFFGFFESINDKSVASVLLNTAGEWLNQRGAHTLCGPFNPSINYEAGLLVEGFNDAPQIMMTYNPPYYASLLESQGLTKAMDFYAYKLEVPLEPSPVIRKIAQRAISREDVVLRPLNKRRWKREMTAIRDIFNAAWEKNWGYIPMSEKEFERMGKELRPIIEEKLVWIVERKGEAVAFILTLPDYHQVFKKIPSGELFPFGIFKLLRGKKHINRARVMAMGVKEEYRQAGLDILLYVKSLDEGEKMKGWDFKEAEMSWVLEDNVKMNSIAKRMGAEIYKTYRIYEKSLF